MVTTDDDALAEAMNVRRNHGAASPRSSGTRDRGPTCCRSSTSSASISGMTDLQGALGLVQLTKLDRFIEERRRWAAYYDEELSSDPVAAHAPRPRRGTATAGSPT
jgi:dTDP-4-amino-4,6-dideoxygalactose transaminase